MVDGGWGVVLTESEGYEIELGFDFTALTHLCFNVALYMYILTRIQHFLLALVFKR